MGHTAVLLVRAVLTVSCAVALWVHFAEAQFVFAFIGEVGALDARGCRDRGGKKKQTLLSVVTSQYLIKVFTFFLTEEQNKTVKVSKDETEQVDEVTSDVFFYTCLT